MRKERELATDCWYNASTKANSGGLGFDGAEALFFIKPADGFELPEIMQWIEETFAVRFNRDHGRTGPGRPRPHAKR
jgi:hypothetical protein